MKGIQKVLCVAALFWGCSLFGQPAPDVVSLKSGAVYKGSISEYVPGQKLVLVLADGRVMHFKAEELKEVDEEDDRVFLTPKRGFVHQSAIGFQLGRGGNNNKVNFAYNMLNGYRHQRSVFGAGMGVETLLEDMYFPFYAQYSYDVLSGRSGLYLAGQAGYTINSDPPEQDQYYYPYAYGTRYDGGYLMGAEVGVRSALSTSLSMTFSAGYRFYRMQGERTQYLWQNFTYPVEQRASLHRFGFKLGFQFN